MISRHSPAMVTILAATSLAAAPALAQGHDHGAPQGQQAAQPHAMVCAMGMLPHGNMGGMGGGMGAMMQQRREGAMQHGQMQHGQQQHGQQQHGQQQPQGEQRGQMQHGAMAGGMKHPLTPMMLIHHASDLELTQDQVSRVTALATRATTDCQGHMKAATDAHAAAFALLGAPNSAPDLAAYEARLREATTHVLQAHLGVVRAGQEARALLTPAQLEKLGRHHEREGGAAAGHSGHTGH